MSMILYNYRYRGPYEYDKFIYNVFQIANETRIMEKKLLSGEYKKLKDNVDELDEVLNKIVGTHEVSATLESGEVSTTTEWCNLQKLLMLTEEVETRGAQ